MNIIFKNSTLLVVFVLIFSIQSIYAKPIKLNITIEGEGGVTVENTGVVCNKLTTPCQLTVDNSQPIKILPTTNAEHYVSSWGNVCPEGEPGLWADKLVDMIHSSVYFVHKIRVADLNGDGKLDLAMQDMRGAGTRFTVAFNLGDGNYSPPKTVYETTTFLTNIKVVDWDKDGDTDVLIVDYDAIELYLYKNDGVGAFSLAKTITLPDVNAISVAIADINNDGDYDLLAGSSDGIRMAWPNNLNDILPALHNGDLSWFINDGNDSFSLHHQVAKHVGIYSIDVADYDNDGDLDIVSAAYKDKSFFLYTNDKNTYSTQLLSNGKSAYSVRFADIDNNNFLDVVGASRGGGTYVGIQKNNHTFNDFEKIHEYPSGNNQALDVADMDSDGDIDVIIGVFGGVRNYSWLENKANQQCIIDANYANDVKFTVTFSKVAPADEASPPSTVTAAAESEMNDDASGGAFAYLLLLSLLLFGFRKR